MILMSASAAELDAVELTQGTSGNDLIVALTPDEFVDGGGGHDIMIALGGSNVLRGGAGHDTLISARGDNVLDGGAGIDKAVYWNGNRADFTITDRGFGIIEIAGGRNSDFVTNVEQVQFQDGVYSIAELLSGNTNAPALGVESQDAAAQTVNTLKTPTDGNDVLIANTPGEAIDALAGDDVVIGLGNGNVIIGSEGNDALFPSGGSNFVDGGAGQDTVIYTGVEADYTLEAAPGNAIAVSNSAGQDLLVNVEKITFQDVTRDVASLNLPPAADFPVIDDPSIAPPTTTLPVEEPVVEEPVAQLPTEQPVVEEPVVEVPVEQPMVDAPLEEDIVIEVIDLDEPVVEEPVVDVPVAEVPVVEEPVVDVPVTTEPSIPSDISFTVPTAGGLYTTVSTNPEYSYELIQEPAVGSLNFYPSGEFDFHAPVGFVGTTSFQYRLISADGSEVSVATIVIQSEDQTSPTPPTVVDPGDVTDEEPAVDDGVIQPPVVSIPVELAPVGPNLIANGSFENGQDLFMGWQHQQSIEGWAVKDGRFVEVQRNENGPAADGEFSVELDSDQNSAISQTVRTEAGKSYRLSLQYSPRQHFGAETNAVEVLWNGVHVDTIARSGLELTGTEWSTYQFDVIGIGSQGTLELRALGTSDHHGGLLDNIQMYELGDPTVEPVVPEINSLVRVGDNLLANSSFESQLVSQDGWKVYDYLEGWTTVEGAGIEIQQGIFGAAYDGLKIVELDSAGNSAMIQNVTTEAGKLYEVSLQYSARPGVRATSNAIEVLWNGVHVDTLSANGEGLTHLDWSEYRLMVEGDGTIGTLEFRALGASDYAGGFLDNIQMFELGAGPARETNPGPVEDPNADAVEVIELDDFGNPLPAELPSATTNLVKAGENLVANGSFENGIDSFNGWRFFDSIEGWSVSQGTVLELQQGLSGPAADGATVLELDADVNSAVRQTIRTEAGASYELNLKYSPRPGFNAESNGVEILWNGVHVDTVTADGSSLTQSQWLDASFLLTGDGSTGTLEFRALGTSDAHGGLIDAVSVHRLVEPGTAIDAPSTDGMVHVSGNLLANSSFESQLTSEYGWKLYDTLDGWSTVDGPGIEVQQDIFGAAADGLKIVELDSAGNSSMAQNVRTEAGKLYEVSVQYSPRPGVTETSNAIEVLWNGVHVDTLSASGEGLTHVEWSEYRFTVEGDGTVGTLEFRAQGASDYTGGFLDNVQMHELGFGEPVAQPAPTVSDELPVLETHMQRVTDNLLANGSFENSLDTFTGWQHLRTIEGWDVTQGDFVEVQRIAEHPAADGQTVVELDSNQNSGISQTVNTQSGKSYELALQYAPRPGVGPETLGIEVIWNGTHVYTLSADGSNLTTAEWLPASFLLQGDGPTGTLEFRAVGTGDHIGGLIDNIQLYELA